LEWGIQTDRGIKKAKIIVKLRVKKYREKGKYY